MPDAPRETATVPVWDPLLRVFHWSLVAAFAVAWWTRENAYETHLAAGYAVVGLLLFRLAWGFVGGRYARFHRFAYGPRAVLRYLRGIAAGDPPRYLGHNPAGSAMIWLLLAGLAVIAASGIALDGAENFAGPLKAFRLFRYTGAIATIHAWSTDAVAGLVALHVAGVAVSSRLHRENLVRAMITGRKAADPRAEDAR